MHENGCETMPWMTQYMGLKSGQLLHVISKTPHLSDLSVFWTPHVWTATQVLSSSYQLLDTTVLSQLPGFAFCGCCETMPFFLVPQHLSKGHPEASSFSANGEGPFFFFPSSSPLYPIHRFCRKDHFIKVNEKDLMCLQEGEGIVPLNPSKSNFFPWMRSESLAPV